jgi:hypothetical protein
MFSTFLGLPVHILIIHAVVAGVPAAALATVAIAVRGGWRERFGWLVVALDAVMAAAVYAARQSGLWLYTKLNQPPAAAQHRQLGLTLIWFVLVLLLVAFLLVLVGKVGGIPLFIVAAVAVLVAGATLVQVARVGHSGSKAVWGPVVSNQ